MTQVTQLENWVPATVQVMPRIRRPDRQRVCEIVGQVAAEVLSEVEAGTWRPPATHGLRALRPGPEAELTYPRLTAVGF